MFIKKLSKAFLVVLDYFGICWFIVNRCGSLWVVLGHFGWFLVLVTTDKGVDSGSEKERYMFTSDLLFIATQQDSLAARNLKRRILKE